MVKEEDNARLDRKEPCKLHCDTHAVLCGYNRLKADGIRRGQVIEICGAEQLILLIVSIVMVDLMDWMKNVGDCSLIK